MKVGQALRLLPDIDLAPPLQAALLASARSERNSWSGAATYATLGTRDVSAEDVRETMVQTLEKANRHLGEVWENYATALERLDNEDGAGAVATLLHNGEMEQGLGRLTQASGWYQVARAVAEELDDRRPEVETLLASGQLAVVLGFYENAARLFQRCLVLAEAEDDPPAAARAAKGLGDVAMRRGTWTGAQTWYGKALKVIGETDRDFIAEVHHARGELARRMGDLPAAREALNTARESFERLGDPRQVAGVLATIGLVESQGNDASRASAALLEALAWARRGTESPQLEGFIRLQIAKLYIDQKRFLEADEELRRVEGISIATNQLSRLAHVYSLFGTVRGLQDDETGFVFFEQALQIASMLPQWPIVEGRVRRDYGAFRQQIGAPQEARAHLQRAHEIFLQVGATADADRVRAELAWLPGSTP